MKTTLKTLLKTTAAVATLIAGSQTWGAGIDIDSGAGTLANAGTSTLNARYGMVSMGGDGTAANCSVIMKCPETELYAVGGSGAALTLNSITFLRDSTLHILGSAAGVIVTAVSGPEAGQKGTIHILAPTVTLPIALDGNKYTVLADYKGAGTAGTTLTIADGSFNPNLVVNGQVTFATITTLAGQISGSGIIRGGSVATLNEKLDNFKGLFVTGTATTFAKGALPKGTLELAHSVTLSSGGAIKCLKAPAAATLTVNGNLTIDELDLTYQANTLTFVPASGVTITIKKIKEGSDQALTINGPGKVKIISGRTSGAVTVTTGILE